MSRVCNICGNPFIYEEGLFDHVSNNHNNCTVCNIQFNDLNPLNQHFFVEHRLKLFKCEGFENYVKTEGYLASHEATIQSKCCGTMFNNDNIYQLNSLFNIYGS